MPYYNEEQILKARSIDLLTYLQTSLGGVCAPSANRQHMIKQKHSRQMARE